MARRGRSGGGSLVGERRRLVLFLGIALALVGGAVDSRLLGAVGAVVALSTLLVWSYVDGAIDRLQATVREARLTVGVWRLRLRERGGSEDATERTDAVERLQRRYAEGDLSEAEFEEQVELVLQTDDEEVAELLVETED